MSKQQTRRSVSTTASTYWRLRELSRKLGVSSTGIVDRLVNMLADDEHIVRPTHEFAWRENLRTVKGARTKADQDETTADTVGDDQCLPTGPTQSKPIPLTASEPPQE